MSFLARIGRLLARPVFSGAGGASGLGFWNLRGVDCEAEVGEIWKSSIPLSCLKWEQRAAAELEPCVQMRDENGDWETLGNHRALNLLLNPNPFFDYSELFDCVRWDYHLSGNGYLLKERSASGRVVELWWIPSWMIDPRWDEDGSEFISCYEYRVNGEIYALPVRDVIHFRNGIDPRWSGRKGLSDFAAVVREVYADDEAAMVVASLMKNRGMPGVIISPASGAANGGQTLNKEQRADLREYWDEEFGGQNRGRPFIHNIPIKIDFPSFSPQQMVLDKIRAVPEQRIVGAFGLTMSVLQLGSGVENSNSRANKSDDRAQCYENCIIPTHAALARKLTRQLLGEFERDLGRFRIHFDASGVRCLQRDENELAKRLVLACGGPFMTPNEARKNAGLKPIVGADALRTKTEKELAKTENEDSQGEGANAVAPETQIDGTENEKTEN